MAVAALVADVGMRDEVVAAAWLHDVVEDCGENYDTLRAEFGADVAALVLEVSDVSKREDGNRAARKALDREHLGHASYEGQTIKLADLIDNTQDILRHDRNFAKLYLAEKRLLLSTMTYGHQVLRSIAFHNLRMGEKELSEPSDL